MTMTRTTLLIAAAVLGSGVGSARAEDGVATIQYLDPEKEGIYRATALLTDDAVEAIHSAFPASKAHTWNTARGESINRQKPEDLAENYREVAKVLKQLANGDVLVLNLHSNATVAGYSTAEGATETVRWTEFYAKYGVEKPPRLALVILNGCMGSEGGKSTDEDAEAIRCALNTTALLSARDTIDTLKSQVELAELLDGFDEKKVIAPAGPNFHLVTSRLVQKEKASLAELRNRAKLLGARSEVTKETEDRDVVSAVEDEPDSVLLPAEAVVVPWQNRDKTRLDGYTSIRFDFDPRREIERVEFLLKVRAPVSAQNDTFRGNVGGRPVHLIEKFRPSKKDETIELKQAWEARGLGGWGTQIIAQLQTGRLRCALGDDSWLEEATLVVYYAGVKK